MRKKALQCVVTFRSTTDAMEFEARAAAFGLSGRIIPLPPVIDAGCGLAWKEDEDNTGLVEKMLAAGQLSYAKICHVVI